MLKQHKVKTFFVGGPKCGTTSLHAVIKKIKGFNVGIEKEPHYFSFQELKSDSYYFDVKFIEAEDDYYRNYDKECSSKENIHAIDFSPSYLANCSSAERIIHYNPDAKIVVVIRDPVERAISHFLMDKNLVGVKDSFFDLLSTDNPLHEKFLYEYIDNSMYYRNIERYIQVFGRERIHIEIFEELFPLSNDSVSNLFKFLSVPSGYEVENVQTNSFDLLNNRLYKKIRQFPWLTKLLRKFPEAVKMRIKATFKGKPSERPSMLEEREYLQSIFYEDSKKLNTLLGLNVNKYWHWLNDVV